MISASEIHELRFEKAAFGYKQEDIDEFLNRLEQEVEIANQELEESNSKIQILADKVREYMRDEDALKDALLGAQKEGHRIVDEANDRAEQIIADAKQKAEEEKKRAMEGMQDQLADAATQIAGRLLRREVSLEDNRRVVDEFFDEVK